MFAITLVTAGMSLTCTCIVSEQFEKDNYSDALKAFRSCLIFSLLLGLLGSTLLFLFSKTISKFWLNQIVSSVPFYIISLGLPFIAVSSCINGYFSAIRKSYKSAISQILELLIKICISILLLNIYSSSKIETICICLILADVISEISSCLFLVILLKIENYIINKKTIKTLSFKKKIFKIALPVSITSYIRSGLSTLKQFIIPTRLVLFGLPYSIALSEYGKIDGMTMSVILFPNVFFTSFSRLLIPEFTSLITKNYKKRILEICKKIFFVTSIFSISISILFFFFSNEISIKIFKNLECSKYIKILSPLVLFMYLDNIIDSMLKGLNKQIGVMFCNILDLLITISFLYFFLPKLGLVGYLFSILISEVVNFSISYFNLYKTIKFKMSPFFICICILAVILCIYEILLIL